MFVPEIGTLLTVQLPGEKIRATVKAMSGNDAVIVELTAVPMTKNHTFKQGDTIACRRKPLMFGFGETWEAQNAQMQTPVLKPSREPQPVEEKKQDAISAGEKPKGRFREHQGTDKPRKHPKKSRPNRGDSTVKRKKASKGKKRGLNPA